MKKFTILCLVVLQSLVSFAQFGGGKPLSKQKAFKSFDKPYYSYTLERISCNAKGCDTSYLNVYINRNKDTETLYYVRSNSCAVRFTWNDITFIDSRTEEIEHYVAPENSNAPSNYNAIMSVLYSELYDDLCAYAFINDDNGIKVKRIVRDSLIDGKKYDVLFGRSAPYFFTKAGKTTTGYSEVLIFYNKKADLVESTLWQKKKMDGTPMYGAKEYVRCRYTNVSFENRDSEYEKVFGENNPIYSIYEYHDDSNPTLSMRVTDKKFADLTDEILDLPFVGTNGDTTTLREQNTWVLLETWYNGCPACKTWIKNLLDQEKEKGGSVFDAENIKVICINPFAKDFDSMKEVEKKLGAEGRLYSANGLQKLIDTSRFPAYYLISPDKNIVYTHYGLTKDNEEFIKAKKDYEQKGK